MKRINFTRLKIKNFLSIGPDIVKIKFNRGLNIITGVNKDEEDTRNGCGKSCVEDAIYFAIFGETLRDLSKQYIVNRKTGKDCYVRLECEIESSLGSDYYVIERTLAPNKVRVFKNDNEVTKSTIPETNKYIKSILEADEELFQNCILMRANSTVPFMNKKKTDRKNFIESIFDLGILADMMKYLKDDIRGKRDEFNKVTSALDVLNSECSYFERKIAQIEEEERTRDVNIENEKRYIKQQIEREEKTLADMDKSILDIQTDIEMKKHENRKKQCENFRSQALEKRYSITSEINSIKKEIEKIKKIGDACPTCNRPYPEEQRNNNKTICEEKEIEISKLAKEYKANEKNFSILDEHLNEVNKEINRLRNVETSKMLLNERIKNTNRTISQLKDSLSRVSERYIIKSSTTFKETLEETRSKASGKQNELNDINNTLKNMNVCEHILGESGVRSYIINKLLDILNSRIAYYLKSIKSTFTFTFDNFFEEEIKDINGVTCLYNNCSGAEMKKIDLAISFAFMDIIRYHRQIDYNITFYDEILDSSLDNKSLELLMNFIAEMGVKNNKSIYVITHKNDISLPQVTETIVMEKRGGFTRKL